MSMDRPVLLPAPRRVEWGEGGIELPTDVFVDLKGQKETLLPSVVRFKNFMEQQLGIGVHLGAGCPGFDEVGIEIALRPDSAGHEQGYELVVDDTGIHVQATTPQGAAFGIATLKQILLGCGREVPHVFIEDHPDFQRRGVMLDVSRGKVPQMDTLYRFVDMLADLKINEFQLYTEHTFAYRNHREVWQNYSPMTGEEIMRLDQYCKERFIDLVPNQNSFGHLTPWLTHERYQHMAETLEGFDLPGGRRYEDPFSLCPLEPSVVPFLDELYTELVPHFSSEYLNVGCDETFDLGQGRSKEMVSQRGEHRVYLDLLLQIYELVQKQGKTMQFWGDIIIQAPELISELPKDIVALEWGYEADHPFARDCQHFAAAGIPFYVCPGTSTWNSLVGRTDNAIANMQNAADNGLQHGAVGYLNTIWGDRGHQDYQPFSYLGIAFGAAISWFVAGNREQDVRPYLNRVIFRDQNDRIGDVLYDLGNVYKAVGKTPHNNSVLGALLHQGFEQSFAIEGVFDEDLDRTASRIEDLATDLPRVDLDVDDAILIGQELRNAVRMLLHACEFGKLKLQLMSGETPARDAVLELARDLDEIIAEHRHLWLARNRIGGLEEMSLAPLRRIRTGYRRLLEA